MIPFVFGVGAVFSALMGVSWWMDPDLKWYGREDIVLLIARTIMAPMFAAWIFAECVNAVRPLRLFDRRVRRLVPRLVSGVSAGVIGACIASLLLTIAEGWAHDVVILSASAAVGTAGVLALMRRVRKGSCIHCGYDVRSQPGPGSPGWGICPECGTSVLPGRDSRRLHAAS